LPQSSTEHITDFREEGYKEYFKLTFHEMMVFQVVVIAVLLVLNTALKGRACDQFCSPVDDLSVRNNLSDSRVKVRLAVSATKADLLNKAGRFRWFYDTVPLYEENCSSDSSDVCRCNLTRQSTTYGTPLCSWNYTCDYNRNRIPQYLWQADCSNSSPPTELTRVSGATADCQECTVYECEPINYKIPVLMLESNPRNCNPFSLQEAVWSWEIKEIPVACSCNNLQQCIPHDTEEEVLSLSVDGPGSVLSLVDRGEIKQSYIWPAIVVHL